MRVFSCSELEQAFEYGRFLTGLNKSGQRRSAYLVQRQDKIRVYSSKPEGVQIMARIRPI